MAYESEMGMDALLELESMDLTGGTLNYGGAEFACCAPVLGTADMLGVGGFSKVTELQIFVRKAVLPEKLEFHSGDPIFFQRKATGERRELKISQHMGVRDFVFAWELTAQDVNEGA